MINQTKPIDIILDKAREGIDLLLEEGLILLTQTEKALVNATRRTANFLSNR